MTMASCVDNAIMLVILLLAFDALRKVTFYQQPLQTVSFVLLCIGAAGKLAWNFQGRDTHWWAIAMHCGFAIYAIRTFGTGAFFRAHSPLPEKGIAERQPK